MSVDAIQVRLKRTLSFLGPYLPLLDSHLVNFITHSLYDVLIPSKFRKQVDKNGSDSVFNLFWQHCRGKRVCDESEVGTFLNSIMEIHDLNRSCNFYGLEELRRKLYSDGCKELDSIGFDEFMSEKKCHEVERMSGLAAELAHFTTSELVVDVGDGKGYLSSFLSLQYKMKVLGLDSSHVKTTGAAERNRKLQKVWKGTRRKTGSNVEPSTTVYHQTTEFITESTDLPCILLREFGQSFGRVGLVGLHTCGDLSPVSLRLFVRDESLRFLINVGCCYHLLTEEGSGEASRGFPLSDYLRDCQFKLGRNARMISLKPKWKIGSQKIVPSESLLYRAVLQQMLVDKVGSLPDLRVGRIAAKCSDFNQYVNTAIHKLGLPPSLVNVEEIERYRREYWGRRESLWIYFMLLVCLSSLVEDLILLDRLLYLRQQGIENSYLVEMFDPVISPRYCAIVAFRK